MSIGIVVNEVLWCKEKQNLWILGSNEVTIEIPNKLLFDYFILCN